MFCSQCGVQLEEDMQICPLCGTPVSDAPGSTRVLAPTTSYAPSLSDVKLMTLPQKKLTWEIVSLILLCGAATTLLVNFIINKSITWSEYPVAICFIIFCYISLFAFSRGSLFVKLVSGLVLSSCSVVLLDFITAGIQWSVAIGIPLLMISTVVIVALAFLARKARDKGINLIAYCFLGAALLCLSVDGILSVYQQRILQLTWSIIVATCILPTVVALLFVHFRLKRGRSLAKTFHV